MDIKGYDMEDVNLYKNKKVKKDEDWVCKYWMWVT